MADIFIAKEKKENPPNVAPAENNKVPNSKYDFIQKDTSVHLFTAYSEKPYDISFKNQEEDEKVLLFVRKHFITNLSWILIGSLMLAIPLIIGPLSVVLNFQLPSFFSSKFVLFYSFLYYLLVLSFLYIKYITWYFNISLVTSTRIVDIDFSDIIYKNMASTKLSLVQDVSYSQTGVLRTFFHFGDVLVQTAGEKTQFDFDAVPSPENVVHIIGELIGKHGTV